MKLDDVKFSTHSILLIRILVWGAFQSLGSWIRDIQPVCRFSATCSFQHPLGRLECVLQIRVTVYCMQIAYICGCAFLLSSVQYCLSRWINCFYKIVFFALVALTLPVLTCKADTVTGLSVVSFLPSY